MLKTTKKLTLGIFSAACVLGGTLANVSTASAANIDGPEVFWKISMWGNPRALSVGMEELAKKAAEETDMAGFCVHCGGGGAGGPSFLVLAPKRSPRETPEPRASRCQAPATQRGPPKALCPVSLPFPGQLPANAISALNGQASAGSN